MSKLDPRIEAVRDAYGLNTDDFWQIPQNKQWVCKHAALEIVATKAKVEWSAPQIIQADTAGGIAVMVVSGKMGERVEWSTGEASPKNNKNSYPWAMAEKRAKDRVVLKLVGIHGLVYSEDEADDFKQQKEPQKPVSSAEQKRGLEEIERDLLDCDTVLKVNECAKQWAQKMEPWSKDFRDIAIPKFKARRDALIAANNDDFPGDTDIHNVAGRRLHSMEG